MKSKAKSPNLFPKSEQATLTPVACLIKNGFSEEALDFLKSQENPELTQGDIDNALIIACEHGENKLVKELIKCGANPKACGHHGIIWACFTKKFEVVETLANHYSSRELKDIIKDRIGDIPQKVSEIIQTLKSRELKTQLQKSFSNSNELKI